MVKMAADFAINMWWLYKRISVLMQKCRRFRDLSERVNRRGYWHGGGANEKGGYWHGDRECQIIRKLGLLKMYVLFSLQTPSDNASKLLFSHCTTNIMFVYQLADVLECLYIYKSFELYFHCGTKSRKDTILLDIGEVWRDIRCNIVSDNIFVPY